MKFRNAALFVAMLLVAAPSISSAATFGAEVFGAFNSYSMEDVNDGIDAANALGANFDNLSSGITGGLGVRLWASPNWMISAGWEPLFLETEDSGSSTTINADANSYQLTAGYFFPNASPNAKYGLGAGVGMYQVGGEISDPSTSLDIEGSGVGFHLMGMGEWTASPGFGFTAGAGYRFADIDVDDVPGVITDATADYSGFMARVGVAFYMPSNK